MKRSRQSGVPQWKPEGQVMTALEQDEKGFYKSEGIIELRIDAFSKFARDGKIQWSEQVHIRGLPWHIIAKPIDSDSDSDSRDMSQSDDDSGQSSSKYLSFYLYCKPDSTMETWECEATYTLRVTAQKDGVRDIIERDENDIFNDKTRSWGFPNFASCDLLLDPDEGYIKDDAIVLQAHVKPVSVNAIPGIHAIDNGPLFSCWTKYPSDFVLVIQGNEVHVQKSILSLHSEFFTNQFSKHKLEKRAILEDVEYNEFVLLLSIIYRTGCSITEKNVETISKLALKFEMAGLLRECETFLMERTANVGRAKALSMAESYGLVYLQGKVIDEIKNVADIKNMKPELDTMSNRTKRMLLDRVISSGPAFNSVSSPQNIGSKTSRFTEILQELASSVRCPSDGALIVENNRIPIHKMYLAMCSDYFTAMFQGEFTESNKDEVVLENFGYGEILELLAVIYPTDSTITDQNIEVILKTAEYFSMPRILEQCKKLLNNSKEISAARKLWLAQRYNLHDLQAEYAKKYKRLTEVEKLGADPEYGLFDDKTRALILDSLTS